MSYVYQHVACLSVIDGDTVRLLIDLGNKVRWTDNFRLAGIDTPERDKKGHAEATEYLKSLLSGSVLRAETHKPDKYGRWLADLWVKVDGGELHVNRMMIVEGHAVEYNGGAKPT